MPPPRPPSRSPRPAVLWCASPAPVRIWTPAPPTGAGLLLPLTGRPAASLLTWRPAGLGSPLCCPPAGPRPPLYGLKLVPSSPPVGSRPFSPPTETGPPPSCLPVGVACSALPSPGASSGQLFARSSYAALSPGDRLRVPDPCWSGYTRRRSAPCTTRRLIRSNLETRSQQPLLRPGGFSLRSRGYPLVAERPFPPVASAFLPSNTIGPHRESIQPGTPLLLGDSCPGPARTSPRNPRTLRRFWPFRAHLGPSGSLPPSTHVS